MQRSGANGMPTSRASVSATRRNTASRGAAADPVPFSCLHSRLQPDAIEGSLVVHIFDAAHDLNVEPAERLLDPSAALARSAELTALLAPRLSVSADGRPLTPQWLAPD